MNFAEKQRATPQRVLREVTSTICLLIAMPGQRSTIPEGVNKIGGVDKRLRMNQVHDTAAVFAFGVASF
jgi:hypothetical protein